MFVLPIMRLFNNPKKFVKRRVQKRELLYVEFVVKTCVCFEENIKKYYEPTIHNGIRSYIANSELLQETKMGFQIKVRLEAEEYKNNKANGTAELNRYVIQKAEKTGTYKKLLNECIEDDGTGRNYKLESFIFDFPEFFYNKYEEEYIPEY